MAEPLFITDLLLAVCAAIGAFSLGRRAARGRTLRWALGGTAVLVAARVVVAGLLWSESWHLVSDRVIVALPVAALPLAATIALAARGMGTRVAGQVAAVGVLISAYLAWVPQDPADRPIVVALSVFVLGAAGAVAVARSRATSSRTARMPWLATVTTAALIAAVVGLYVQNQAPAAASGHEHHGIPVAALTGPRQAKPDVKFTMTAAHHKIRLSSGTEVDALTFNGVSPGPELRVRQGQLVEVTLVNTDVAEGVTLHWHGVDVPNAEDGVPGLTQDAVAPGGRHVYRFVPNRPGTFWYHTHRDSKQAVARGLFGALLIDAPEPAGYEATLFAHDWPGGKLAFGTDDTQSTQTVAPGKAVRLRLINSSQDPQRIQIAGTEHRVTAIDGNAIHQPGPLPSGGMLQLSAGGRYDVTFPMPATPVALTMDGVTRVLTPGSGTVPEATGDGPLFDATSYGTPDRTPAPRPANRTYDLVIDNGFGFANGTFAWANTVNGASSPAIPTLMVDRGDTVRMRFTNRGLIDHPMHLHGHRIRVLSRNESPVTGSPWWTDTLNVAPGESFEITFTADNPGIWMDHCHNFEHAAEGMLWHLAYTGVSGPSHGSE
ncbi:multicopper oxidase family protein [Actinoplanes sp. NPDC051859]|uniref:multicopper oxidase family protein n=1 Tax=Actinoplanes sp. NPDC051859 TaxID=3363909 RepID=UPI00378C0922